MIIWFGSGLSTVVVGEIKPFTATPPWFCDTDEAGEGPPAGELADVSRVTSMDPGVCIVGFDGDAEELIDPEVGTRAYPTVLFVSTDEGAVEPSDPGAVVPATSKLHRTPA